MIFNGYFHKFDSKNVLYDNGNPCTLTSGGWQCWASGGTSELLSNYIHFSSSSYNQSQNASTSVPILLDSFSTLYAEMEVVLPYDVKYCSMTIAIADSTPLSEVNRIAKEDFRGTGKHTFSVDISSFTGSYYIVASAYYLGNGYVYKVWLE